MEQYVEPLLPVVPLVTFFLGLIIGHWLAVSRDRRREFNDAATPIRTWLLAEIERPSLYTKRPSAIELDTFLAYLGTWSRWRFRTNYEAEQEARRKAKFRDNVGGVHVEESAIPRIKKHLKACLSYTKRR